jgi:hypothetical protein
MKRTVFFAWGKSLERLALERDVSAAGNGACAPSAIASAAGEVDATNETLEHKRQRVFEYYTKRREEICTI